MKVKLDENLPVALAKLLSDLGHDAHTAHDEHLSGHDDTQIWQAAQSEARFLITQDLDFSDSRRFVPGSHFGILVVRLHWPSRRNLLARISDVFQNENVADWVGCFVVATERKIRILKPGA